MRLTSIRAAIAASFLVASTASAADFVGSSGLQTTGQSSGLTEAGAAPLDLPALVGQITGGLLSLVGSILVVLFIYAGFLWMTAQGSEENVKKAKAIIKNAAIGMVLTFSAYAIANTVATVVSNATGLK